MVALAESNWQYVKTCTYHQLDAANTLPIYCQLNWMMPIKPMQHMSIVTQGRVFKIVQFGVFFHKERGGLDQSQNLIIHRHFLAEKYKKCAFMDSWKSYFDILR